MLARFDSDAVWTAPTRVSTFSGFANAVVMRIGVMTTESFAYPLNSWFVSTALELTL